MSIRRSQLRLDWDDLLSGEQISQWMSLGTKGDLPKGPGAYRWTFRDIDSGRPSAYVGEAADLSSRLARYLNAENNWTRDAQNSSRSPHDAFTERDLTVALRANRREPIARIGARLAWCDTRDAQLQKLRVEEEGLILGVEVSARLLDHKIGRVFLEHWAILKMESEGYRMLNRDPSQASKAVRQKLRRRPSGRTI